MTDQSRPYILYGLPHSLYTGVARCYLRTQGIVYVEHSTAHPDFINHIIPKIGRSIIPVLETPEGEIIQDSVDIIDHFEQGQVPYSAYPAGSLQQIISVILLYYGSQAMLRHAMHYRWSYRDEQYEFLLDAFSAGAGPGEAGQERAIKIMNRMNSYLPHLGVTEQSIGAIESSYENLLAILNRHFTEHPYLLGGRPSLADYGMIGPLFAHLGRDPVPCNIMKTQAPKVFRWVERMTAPGLDTPEYVDPTGDFLPNDAIPESLQPLLQQVADEIFPELTDKLHFMDAHIEKLQPANGDPVSAKPHQRNIGAVETTFTGIPVQSGVAPYLLYVLRKADAVLANCSAQEAERVQQYLQRYGLDKALPGERGYTVGRKDNIEVWERS